MGERLVLDLETQKEFAEVDGRRPELLLVSVCGVYSYATDRYIAYTEAELPALAPVLQQAELVVGFNINKFDFPVLQPYVKFPLANVPTLDILDEIVKNAGHRVSLDSVCQATLGTGKTGHGLEALRWFKEGKIDQVKKYCLDDVRLTRDVYEYGKKHGKLFATSRFSSDKIEIPVLFADRKRDLVTITKMLNEAFAKKLQVEIEYLAQSAIKGEPPQRTRKVDIYSVADPYFEGFCHVRNDVRQFRIDRVLDLKPVWTRYQVPSDYMACAIPE